MAQKKRPKFGQLAFKYHFSLNPYPSLRFSKCPDCERKTGQRKLPLLIHVDPDHLLSINYTNRYCTECDMLIGHKDEIEHHLTGVFSHLAPQDIGNDYLIMGTVEKKIWRQGLEQPQSVDETIRNAHDFKSYDELRMTMAGWFREDHPPPVMAPPVSTEWIKPMG